MKGNPYLDAATTLADRRRADGRQLNRVPRFDWQITFTEAELPTR
jgi:hypothetical protein